MENFVVKILFGFFIFMLIMFCVLFGRLLVVNKRGEWKFGDEISSVYVLIFKGFENIFLVYWNIDLIVKKLIIEEFIFLIYDILVFFDIFFILFCLSFGMILISSYI